MRRNKWKERKWITITIEQRENKEREQRTGSEGKKSIL